MVVGQHRIGMVNAGKQRGHENDDVIKWKNFRVTGHLCGEVAVTSEFPTQRPVTRSFDVFFDLHLNKRLSKQSGVWWFETPLRSLWRNCNDYVMTWKTLSTSLALCDGNPSPARGFLSQRSNADIWYALQRRHNECASQITGASIVYLTVCTCADQIKHQSFASLAFVRRIDRWPVDSPRKGPVSQKTFPSNDVIMVFFDCQTNLLNNQTSYWTLTTMFKCDVTEMQIQWIGAMKWCQ